MTWLGINGQIESLPLGAASDLALIDSLMNVPRLVIIRMQYCFISKLHPSLEADWAISVIPAFKP